MAGPEKQFDQTEALRKAMNIFWEKGFEATSMQDLVNEMGINRASMYQTYGNKHALFIAAIDQYINASIAETKTLLESSDTPLKNLYHLFEHILENSLQGKMNGCFINNTAAELGPHDPLIADKIRFFWNQFETLFNNSLTQAVEIKELNPNTDTKKFATLLNSTLQGLVIKTKANVAKDQLISDLNVLFDLIKNSGKI